MTPPGRVLTPRRQLHFERLDEAIGDADVLAAAELAGTLSTSGTWTFGQALNHLASWADYCYDGVPLDLPLPIRLVMRLLKRPILHRPMRPGSRLPGVPGGTLATDVVPSPVGLEQFRRSFTRLGNEPPTRPHMAFGRMTPAEWSALHRRHAELHLSFFHPGAR